MKAKTHVQEIKGLKFPAETLKIALRDSIRYKISAQQVCEYSSLYSQQTRFFILYIEEVNKESPPLFKEDVYEYKFIEPGIYTVCCLNYPKLRQTVIVEAEKGFGNENGICSVENLSEISQMESEVSVSTLNQESMFFQSEENSNLMSLKKEDRIFQGEETRNISSLKSVGGNNFRSIGSCLELLSKGATSESVLTKFPELFEDNCGSTERSGWKKTNDDLGKSEEVNSLFDESAFAQIKSIGKEAENERGFEKIYSVYKINKEKPDNLFKIFSRLKNDFEGESEKDESKYRNVEELKNGVLDGIDLESLKPVFPNGFRSRKLRRAITQMEKRFSEK